MEYKQTLMWKEINEISGIFGKIESANTEKMKELVSKIKDGNAVNFVVAARGASKNAMVYFKYVLEINSNYTVGLSAPSVITLYNGKINYSNSIVIGCSESGLAEDVLEVLKKANEQGAITIGITNDTESPIAKEAKYHLFCNAGKEEGVVATKSFISEMYLLLWLASELSSKRYYIKLLRDLDRDINPLLEQIDGLTTVYAEKFKHMNEGFVLSRGLSYPIALEQELLLQEICRLQIKGSAGSEFCHGAVAMVEKNKPIIMYCAKYTGDEELQSIIRADQVKLIERMLLLKAPVLLVTNDCLLVGKFSKCNEALISFNVPEELAVFPFAIFAQMFACKLAVLKGCDPDNPVSMEKNTITK